MTIMQSESVRRRRGAYHRSHTLCTLPTHLVQEVDNEQEDESISERSKLIEGSDSPMHTSGSTSDLDKLMASYTEDTGKQLQASWKNANTKSRRPQLFTKKSLSNPGSTVNGNGTKTSSSGDAAKTDAAARAKRLGRVSSTPSMLFTKVKDRIRETMFQTSAEWPYAAAIIQERRQRSVDAFAARVAKSRKSLDKDEIEIEQIPLKDICNKKKRSRVKSEPIPAVILTETNSDLSTADVARLAFRRRSISEDTYDRRPCLPKVKVDQPDNSAGIICSNEDLQAIVSNSGTRKKSPRPKKRSSLEPQGSVESSNSTHSSRSARSSRACSMDVDLSPSDRVDLGALRTATSDDLGTSLNIPGTTYADGQRDVRPKDKYVARSVSMQSGNSMGTIQSTSPRGSKTSLLPSDLRPSDQNEKISRTSPMRSTSVVDSDDSGDEDTNKPVPEVVFDEFGQTWDVYGAEFDPEAVGDAIQRHLMKLMQRNQGQVKRDNSCDGKQTSHQSRESGSFWLKLLCLFNKRDQHSSS